MQHFILFLIAVFFALVIGFFNKSNEPAPAGRVLRIYGYSSFSAKTGAGSLLKEQFEKSCDCRVEFVDSPDSSVLLQRVKLEAKTLGSDLVIGLDAHDLQKALIEIDWRKIDPSSLMIDEFLKPALGNEFFIPYDWGVLALIGRKEDPLPKPKNLNDLLKPQYKNKIALMDPRTSSPGLQFVSWVIESLGKSEGEKYLSNMFSQAHSFSPSWSTAYGLFSKKQVNYVFSYVTSPIYHQLEENNFSIEAIPFSDRHPIQVEFLGIPSDCKECELAESFVNLILSDEGQRLVMRRNYMLPIRSEIAKNTEFESATTGFNYLSFKIPTVSETDSLIKAWSSLRRGQVSEK